MNILELLIEVILLFVLIKVSKLAKGSPDSSIWLGPCVVGDVGFLMLINKFWIHPLWVSPVLCLLHGISAIPLWVCSYLAAFHPWNRWERPRHDHFLMPGGRLIWCQVQPWLPSLRHLHFSGFLKKQCLLTLPGNLLGASFSLLLIQENPRHPKILQDSVRIAFSTKPSGLCSWLVAFGYNYI